MSAFCATPLYAAMSNGTALWSDLLDTVEQRIADRRRNAADRRAQRAAELAAAAALDAAEHAFWSQPFARNLETPGGDWLDFSACSDADWEAAMTWLYATGWYLESESRRGCRATPSDEPPRIWIPPSAAAAGAAAAAAPPRPAAAAARPPRPPAYRPIFCSGGEKCKGAECAYEHGDTIRVMNQPCQFGATCSKRTVGFGATPCCRLHPDETWTEELVRHRPPPPADA